MKKQLPDPLEAGLRHLHDLPRAQPPAGLLKKIEARTSEAKIVALIDWRQIAAAAVLIAALNVAALAQYITSDQVPAIANNDTILVSDYELYY